MNKKQPNQNPGRKRSIDPAIYRYCFRMNIKENEHFKSLYLNSGAKDKTHFIKSAIFGKPIKVVIADKEGMNYYRRLTNLYTQLQTVGVKYNQLVKILHSAFGEKRTMQLMCQLERATREFITIYKQIIQLTHEFEQQYLNK